MSEEKNKIVPWQFSTAGMVVGFLFGVTPLLIALLGNHQLKQGKDVSDLKKAYNIIFILSIVFIALIILWFVFIILIAAMSASSYGSYY